MSDGQTPKTYVLMGFDHNGAFKTEDAIYKNNPNFVVIEAKGHSIEDAAKQIPPGSNVILEAHGGKDGSFDWNKGEKGPSYSNLLSALPEGTKSVTISGCYGGTVEAEKFLEVAPKGAVIQSRVGADNENLGALGTRFAQRAHGTTSTELFVESMAAFDPKLYQEQMTAANKASGSRENADPEHALPHIIGIGGYHSGLNIQHEMDKVVSKQTQLDPATWNASEKAVEKEFGATQPGYYDRTTSADTARVAEKMREGLTPQGGSETRIAIQLVARKMQEGQEPEGAQEKRIAYALTAEYMDKSGELQRRINIAKGESVNTPAINNNVPPGPKTPTPAIDPIPGVLIKPEPHPVELPADPAKDALAKALALARKASDKLPRTPPAAPHAGDIAKASAELAAVHKVVDSHHLVTAAHQNANVTKELEQFAKMMHISGVRTDAPQLSDVEIRKIQTKLHVKDDGLIGEKTLHAMEEKIQAMATPGQKSGTPQLTH